MQMNPKKKLAVFDLDGTLFDTEEVNFLSYQAAAGTCGYEITKEQFSEQFVGKNYKEFLPKFGITDVKTQEKIHELKKTSYPKFLKNARRNEHLFSMIECMKSEYILAVATTASKKNVCDILSCFGVLELFDFLVTQEDVKELKPNPECYLCAMEKAGIAPEDTVIFEDSAVGLSAAIASGASVMKVEHF